MRQMKLATKLALGFGSVLILALILGGMAVVNMSGVKGTTLLIQKENVPEVAVANDLERSSLYSLYAMRGYAFTEETQYLDQARRNLEEVKRFLTQAKEHGASSPRLAKLKESAAKAETAALEYEKLANEAVALTAALEKDRKDARSPPAST